MTVIRTLSGAPTPALGPDPDRAENLDAYRARRGHRAEVDPDTLLARVEAADLRGHGGAGFPSAVKLRAVRERGWSAGTAPVVVANGEEGEPGSVKDRWLVRARPHLVLDGLVRAARITGAERGYVYLSDSQAERSVRKALAATRPVLPIEVVRTEPAYVAGEESAVVRRIDGGPALPTAKPPRPFEHGVGGAPTLVANVETLARLALLTHRDDAAETVLLTLSGGSGEALLTEARYGTTLRELARLQGTPVPRAVLMGGLFGGLLASDSLELPLDRARLALAGTGLGCGAIRFLAPDECPVSVAADAVDHLAAESSRQCGVCVSGTRSLRDTLVALTRAQCPDAGVDQLARWSQGLPGRGACGLLDAAAKLAATLLAGFPELVGAHLRHPCSVCAATPPAAGARLRVPVPEPTGIPHALAAVD